MVGFIVGGTLTWELAMFAQTSIREGGYQDATIAFYFDHLSEHGLTAYGHYNDCSVEKPREDEKGIGIAAVGVCRSNARDLFLRVALSQLGNMEYFEQSGFHPD